MKLRRFASAFLAIVMVGVNVLNGIIPVIAADDPTIQNEPPVIINGDDDDPSNDIVLSKVVESVPGWANKWKVTLRIEAPAVTVTSDTVLVIDQSNSMSGNRLSEAKEAADSLAEQLLPEGNTVNRIAVLSFGSEVHERTGFSNDYDTVSDAISDISASGGTFTQAGLHDAVSLLSSSSATYKNIILLSDGVPTYSYRINNVGDHLQDGGPGAHTNQRETVIITDASDFDYTTRVGNGGYNIPDGQEMWHQYWHQGNQYRYYNHGNSAISEANFFNDSDGGTLWTIVFNAGTQGNNVLKQMASSDDNYYVAGTGDLEDIFNAIAGSISSLITNASVHDTMGVGVTTDGETSLDWKPNFVLNEAGDKYIAQTSYEVEMNEDVFSQTASGGFYALNDSAVLTYSDSEGEKTAEFPIPKAKPFNLDVEKYLTVDGEEKIGEEFTFTISGNGETKEYTVKSGEDHIIPVPMPILLGEEYTITEIGVGENNDVLFEYYDAPKYTVNGNETNKFVVTSDHGDTVNIKIINNYETTTITSQKVWEDDDDRDGLRKDYGDLYAVVKDGDNNVAMEKIEDQNGSQTFENYSLPKNRNGSPIKYTVVEAIGCEDNDGVITCDEYFESGDSMNESEYEVTIEESDSGEFTITNEHTPLTTKLDIKKIWDVSAGTLPTVTPSFVTVEVSNDKNNTKETVTLKKKDGDGDYVEWTGTFEGFMYEDGEQINYTVKEKEIGTDALDTNNELYVLKDGVLEGKWVASQNGLEITNTWTPAATEYSGVGKFYIEKLDQNGDPIEGVTFTLGDDDYTTGSDGKVEVKFSESTDEPEDSYTFEITETDAPDYYDLIDGTEILSVTTNLELTVDRQNLKNTYAKTFVFEVTEAVDGYVWDGENVTLIATDQELADSLMIEKIFEGISEKAFEEKSQIKFKITGPEGFTEMTVGIDDGCEISDGKLICIIDGSDVLLPVGEYTVTESNADITNFTYTSEPTNGEITKDVELGGTAEFEFKNVYESVKTATFKVKKIWEDDGDRDGVRPDTLEITLLADDKAYGEPVELKGGDWEYEWTKLPLVNEDAEEIEYSAEEEDLGGIYESDGGKMENGVFTITNTHESETKKITIKKTWDVSAGNLPTSAPTFIMVELSNDQDDETETVRLEGTDYGEWISDEITVYVYANQGETVTYQVKELGIGAEDNLNSDDNTLYIYNGEILEGKWVAEESGLSVKNTWTPATPEYEFEGEDKFEILKLDEEGDTMSGVVFAINDDTEATNDEGVIEIEVPISEDEAEEKFEYEISEKESPYGYDEVEGSATITVTCTSEFKEADDDSLVNTFIKTCEFEKTGDEGFVWDEEAKRVIVTNVRSVAGSLTIRKVFSGVSEAELSGLTFTITGPEDFGEEGEMEISFSDDCVVSEGTAICEIDAKVPTGEYSVKENNAEISGYTLTVEGDGETIDVEKDAEVEFVITNTYEKIPTSCEDGGECGGGEEEVPIIPDTGVFTGGNNGGAILNSDAINSVKVVAIVALISVSLIAVNIRELEKYKSKK